MNPDPIRVMKYPSEIIKNNVPASAWVRFRSVSILGVRGASMIRDPKLIKKIEVRINRGPTCFKNELAELFAVLRASDGFEDLSIFWVNLRDNIP
jgi:hypothetical protein